MATCEPTPTQACPDCGQPQPVDLSLPPEWRGPTLCPGCIADRERELEDFQQAERWALLCPPLYQATVRTHPRWPQEAWAQVEPWAYGPRGLILLGDTGRGKTRVMFELLRRLFVSERRSVSVLWPEELRDVARHAASAGNEAKEIRRVGSADVLGLDDPLIAGAADERVAAFLTSLIDYRLRYNRPLIVTAQIKGAEYEASAARWGDGAEVAIKRAEALMRRLREACAVVNFGANGHG